MRATGAGGEPVADAESSVNTVLDEEEAITFGERPHFVRPHVPARGGSDVVRSRCCSPLHLPRIAAASNTYERLSARRSMVGHPVRCCPLACYRGHLGLIFDLFLIDF